MIGLKEREESRHYISASDSDIDQMKSFLGIESIDELFSHLPENIRMESLGDIPEELNAIDAKELLERISKKNKNYSSCIGDGLLNFKTSDIIQDICNVRNLGTAYTPYQPERSQGTLITQWIYQCVLSKITGFEAINASLYDRASALFEALMTASRMNKKSMKMLLSEGLLPSDLEVVNTMIEHTPIEVEYVPLCPKSGLTNGVHLSSLLEENASEYCAIVFPQTNSLGLLEDVHFLTNLASSKGLLSIASIDPALLSEGGLIPPSEFGNDGVDVIIGEVQHLAIAANFGGPGVGLFGVRHNAKKKNAIRVAPGRFIGKAKDRSGRDCYSIILSSREQHIRKEKATSNICSNQAFIATLIGAVILEKGDVGLKAACDKAQNQAREMAQALLQIPSVELAYSETPFLNEFTLALPRSIQNLIDEGRKAGLHLGVDVSDRIEHPKKNLLKMSFTDQEIDLGAWVDFFEKALANNGEPRAEKRPLNVVPKELLRKEGAGLKSFPRGEIVRYYQALGDLNVSPDDTCYPLGSCTMKYNPVLNEWAAGLSGFTGAHPQAPVEDAQGCMEVLYEIQEWFKGITGLAAVTTQPVAGAQGELVGLKMFQAYHKDRGDLNRDLVLIPRTAHGTNFATAAVAGFGFQGNQKASGGLISLDVDSSGQIELDKLDEILKAEGHRISGIMITNPNTAGIFEKNFKLIAEKIHSVGGLVYMDGANMNAIAGWVDLGALGVDAVHNNTHKTWSIPHGGGGPGDAIVGVSEKLRPFLPGHQIEKNGEEFIAVRPEKSIGSIHRHWGNFAHKVRCYAYLLRLGREGIKRMSGVAVLSACYLKKKLGKNFTFLPKGSDDVPRMHEFIVSFSEEEFEKIESVGVGRTDIIPSIGKLFLDYGLHTPTVAFPEPFGLMIEPTESYTLEELDRLLEVIIEVKRVVLEKPEVLKHVPFFTPIDRVKEVEANRNIVLYEELDVLPKLHPNRVSPEELKQLSVNEVTSRILNQLKEIKSELKTGKEDDECIEQSNANRALAGA